MKELPMEDDARPRRIAFVTTFPPLFGGGEVVVHNLANTLGQRGHEVVVVYVRAGRAARPLPADAGYSVAWARDLGSAEGTLLSVDSTLRRVLRTFRPHVVQTVAFTPFLPRLCRAHGARLVVNVQHPFYRTWRELTGQGQSIWNAAANLRRYRLWPLHRYVCDRAHLLVAISEYIRGEVHEKLGVRNARERVIPNGVAPVFFPVGERRETERAFSSPARRLVFFGRLVEQKGVDVLLRALAGLKTSRPGLCPRLRIIGHGPLRSRLEHLATSLRLGSQVTFAGSLPPPEVADELAAADLCILPSRAESFCIAAAEAMAAGVPVISTAVGGIPEVVVHRRTGWLVPPGDPVALQAAMEHLLADASLRTALARAGRRRALRLYRWERVTDQYVRAYRELLIPPAGRTGSR